MLNVNKTTKLAATMVAIAAVVFSVNSFVTAQEADGTVNMLESQMQALVESQTSLANSLQELVDPGVEEPREFSQTAYGDPMLNCIAELDMMNYSNFKNPDADWDFSHIFYFNQTSTPVNQYIDLNGDGLTDYLIAVVSGNTGGIDSHYSCAYLNNGHGFDLVHVCMFRYFATYDEYRYWGDCADYGN